MENKYLVSDLELEAIKKRLTMVMQQDIHQKSDAYEIRSIYFDDWMDSCLEDNDAGTDPRKKYRIRTYDANDAFIRLEIKEKQNGFTKKNSCCISKEEYESLVYDSNTCFSSNGVMNQFLLQKKLSHMKPKIIIAYERTAFVHPSGNVRITFDRNIMASKIVSSFFEERILCPVPVLPTGIQVLEVKYDEFLPDMIAKQLETGKLSKIACSKYYLGRMAARGEFYVR